MPELPDVTLYCERLASLFAGQVLRTVRVASPFLLRSVEPPLGACFGRRLAAVRRLGKRIVLDLGDELYVVIHLMIAGRLRLKKTGVAIPKKLGLAAFDFESGSILFSEASPKKRASLHVVRGAENLATFDRGGLDVFAATPAQFAAALQRENHTLKHGLTDPRLFDGIGNAYSDEILHRARLSPVALSQKLDAATSARLHTACKTVLAEFTDRLRTEVGDGFPETVTAFRPDMAVHGKHGQPCPVCQTPVQRIRYADNETNYCPTCQTGGKLLADRSLSRLLRRDWPKNLDALDELKADLRARVTGASAAENTNKNQ